MGYIQTMEKEEEAMIKTLMHTLKGHRVPIVRQGRHFVAEIMVHNEDEKTSEHHVPKKHATKSWSAAREMDVDDRTLKLKKQYGALIFEDEQEYEESFSCQPCSCNANPAFAGQGRSI